MNPLGLTVALGLLAGVWAQFGVLQPLCDSPEAEEAALVAQDYLNAQHTHGYKYALNRIEDIKVYTMPNGDSTYVLEVDLLETDCHVLDPTPVANCTVRPKILTAVEGDCDVVLKKVGGALTVTAFKCKTEESREDLCLGCPTLLPLNDTTALDLVHASLARLNNITMNETYTLLEVGRLSSQIVSGGLQYSAEYVVVEANCTNDACVPLNEPLAARGICKAKGVKAAHAVDCKMFTLLMPVVDPNSTVAAAPPPAMPPVHAGSLAQQHGLKHHKLTRLHNPHLSSLLSAESGESSEIVPVVAAGVDAAIVVLPAADPTAAGNPTPAADLAPAADPAAAPADPAQAADPGSASDTDPGTVSDASNSKELSMKFKREVPAEPASVVHVSLSQTGPALLVPACPGRVRFFK